MHTDINASQLVSRMSCQRGFSSGSLIPDASLKKTASVENHRSTSNHQNSDIHYLDYSLKVFSSKLFDVVDVFIFGE